MSASSKKKLRKEQNAALLTERQRKEQSEAKKLKAVSIVFIVIMVCVVITALTVMAIKSVQNSGILERNTIAATVGEHEINSVEANYYFADLTNSTYSEWYSMYGDSTASYMSLMGLDLTKPLDEQVYEEGTTWADYFLESALDQAKSDYALYDMAVAEGFTLSEEDQSVLDSSLENVEMYAMLYGYQKADDYLKAMYGNGSNMETYREYAERSAIASAYYNAYNESLVYEDADIRAYEKDIYNNYSSYSYANYYLASSNFLPEDVETPTDEDNAAAAAAAKEAAESLLSVESVEELDEAIGALEINADVESAASTRYDHTLYTGIASTYRDWLTDSERKENDIEIFANETTSSEDAPAAGYYVVMYLDSDDNTKAMSNVRHLLVKHEHEEGEEHTEDDLAALKEEAEGYLQTWLDGEKTEDSFIALVKEHSDDSSASTGGLFEDINPDSSFVPSFLNWSIDENRKAGDAEVIESEYGYHVMYYVGDDELTYRDHMIINDMKEEALDAWYNSIKDAVTLSVLDTSRLNLDRVLSAS